MITINNLVVKNILNDLSCTIPAGRITTFIGKSGVGKTTLLRTIAQLNNQSYSGTITINGINDATMSPQQRAQNIGFVFQDFNLFSNLTVIENCTQPLQLVLQQSAKIARQTALCILTNLGMEPYLQRFPSQLSGGQQQRVAIARALCLGPKTLLLDEPTSALDPANTTILVELLHQLKQQGIAIAVASQDMVLVKAIMDHTYLLQDKQIIDHFDCTENTSISPVIALFLQ